MSDEKCCFVDQRFEIVVNELRDAFGGVTHMMIQTGQGDPYDV